MEQPSTPHRFAFACAVATLDVIVKLRNPPLLRQSTLEMSSFPIQSESSGLDADVLSTTGNYSTDLEKQPFTSATDSTVGVGSTQQTFLYLGFGSNLARSTFEGRRKIRPLAQVNVHVPEYELTFDLPGVAYVEPCFGNSRRRSSGEASQGERDVVSTSTGREMNAAENLGWSKGLVGTVYEVTAADFKHIIETEGAGAAYVDTLVEAWPIPAGTRTVPDPDSYTPSLETPVERIPDLSKPDARPKPFLAHTLVAPLPSPESHLYRKQNWAQPSPRYLGLIQTGARERGLPDEYIAWLDSLKSFETTTWRQNVGKYTFMTVWLPVFLLITGVSRLFVDERGRAPAWLARMLILMSESVWWSYDTIFKRLAGEGEHTIGT